jgi:hypothetical protein
MIVAVCAITALAVGAARAADPAPDGCEWRRNANAPADSVLFCKDPQGVWQGYLIEGFKPDTQAQAQQGQPQAMLALGRFFLDGPEGARSADRASEWLSRAAALGEVQAMVELGIVYREGLGTPKDFAKSTEWFRKAAAAGDAEGMADLGLAYAGARGVTQDDAEAVKWFRAASEKGDLSATVELGESFVLGRGTPRNLEEGAALLRRAADAGAVTAMRDLAYLYGNGFGVTRDPAQAARWAQAAKLASRWTALPTEEEIENTFPVEAAVAGVDGQAFYICRVGRDRSPQDCHAVGELPAGFGFAEAGLSLLPKMRLANGLPEGSEIRLPVRFTRPTGIIASAQRADVCASYALALGGPTALSGSPAWWASYWLAVSRNYAKDARPEDTVARLTASRQDAASRIAEGKERGLFGNLRRCSLN